MSEGTTTNEPGTSEKGPSRVSAILQSCKRLAGDPLRAGIILGGVLASLGAVALVWILLTRDSGTVALGEVEQGLAALDERDYLTVRKIAAELQQEPDRSPRGGGAPAFLLGSAAAYQARDTFTFAEKQRRYQLAARHLNEARFRGWPAGRESEGFYLLGESLVALHRYDEAADALKETVEAESPYSAETMRLLAIAALKSDPPRLKMAVEQNSKFLAIPKLTDLQKAEGDLLQAEIMLQGGDLKSCRKSLEKIAKDNEGIAASVAMLQGKVELAEGKFEDAAKAFTNAITLPSEDDEAVASARYLLGIANLKLGKSDDALEAFRTTRQTDPTSPAGVAASLEEAKLLLIRNDEEKAFEAFDRTLKNAAVQTGENEWLSERLFAEAIRNAGQDFVARKRFELAVKLAENITPSLPAAEQERVRSQVYKAWAENLLAKASGRVVTDRLATAAKGRLKYRRAGQSFAKLADFQRSQREYPLYLWQAAQNFAQGHGYEQAIEILLRYLDEGHDQTRAGALTLLGECQLALGENEKALNALERCIATYPRNPESYQARITASAAYRDLNELDKAESLLVENLQHEALSPRSSEWRDSLFAIAELHAHKASLLEAKAREAGVDRNEIELIKRGLGDLEKSFAANTQAILRLEEALARYPDAPQALLARYRLATTQRLAARYPERQLKVVTIARTRRDIADQQMLLLNSSANEYANVISELTDLQDEGELSPLRKAMLRNSYFCRADVLFSAGNYTDAIDAYASASNKYNQHPSALEALMQIARCYRELDQPNEAKGAMEQAKVVLNRIPPEANFLATTRYTRTEWADLLEWQSAL